MRAFLKTLDRGCVVLDQPQQASNSRRIGAIAAPCGWSSTQPRSFFKQALRSRNPTKKRPLLARHIVVLVFWFGCVVAIRPAQVVAAALNTNDWAFLDNGHIHIGVKKTSGACIGYLSLTGSNRNLLNHHDQGRFIQQSFYGDADGTLWNKQPWRWNPVQGGDWKGNPAKLLSFKSETNSLYARSTGRHWSGCVDLPDVAFEQWISLTGRLAHIRYRMTYTGDKAHAIRDHEIPAVFVEPDLDTLVLYDGEKPWTGGAVSRSRPGWPNESRKFAEQWAAYVDKNDFGVGVYVPAATNLTCYRFGEGGSAQGACAYFAPLIRFAVTPGLVFDYDVYVVVGTPAEMRGEFHKIHHQRPHRR